MTVPFFASRCLSATAFIIMLAYSSAAGGQTGPSDIPVPSPHGRLPQSSLSVEVPIPSPRPQPPDADRGPTAKPEEEGLPKKERACRAELAALGVTINEQDPIKEEDGCRIPHPIIINNLSATVALEPEALVNCATALAFARFVRDKAEKIAIRHFSRKISSVRHASAYVCRPRNGTKTLSEHAFGNALDIASFTLTDGTTVPVQAYDDAKSPQAGFIGDIRRAVCGPFKTVLGPGSDADHGNHFHLDMKARRNDSAYCK